MNASQKQKKPLMTDPGYAACGNRVNSVPPTPRLRLLPALLLSLGAAPVLPQETLLDTTVVTASRAQETVREVSSNVTVITETDIKASTANSVADVLVQQGFFTVNYNDTAGVQIRGFGRYSMQAEHSNEILILLNGRRTGNANPAVAGLANVERIEIIRGPSAVQYGPSAMGGVINIITRRGKEGALNLSAEAGFGSDNLTREKLAFSGAKNGFDFAVSATNYKRDDLTVTDNRRWYHSAINHNTMANIDLGYTFNKNHRIGINHNYGDIKSVLPENGIRPYSGNTQSALYSFMKKSTRNTALSYTGSTQDKHFDWSTSYSAGSFDSDADYLPASSMSRYRSFYDSKFFNAQAGYNGSMFSLSAGLDQYKYDLKSGNPAQPYSKSSIEDLGLYATGKLRLLDERLVFSAGLRQDEYKNKNETLPRVKASNTTGSFGAACLPVDWLKLRANYAEGFKMPAPEQVAGDDYSIANHSLKPETSKTWEFGADINWNHANASLTYFHSDWNDKIVTKNIPGTTCGFWSCSQYQNLRSATLAGLEGAASVDIGKAFRWNYNLKPYVSFTWLETRKSNDRDAYITYQDVPKSTLRDTPDWMVSYGIDYAHPGYKIKSRINANYYGKMYQMDYSQGYQAAHYVYRKGGTVTNLSLEKELTDLGASLGKLTLRTEVNNLFDSANEMWLGYPGPGRSFYVGLRYDFK